MGEIDSIYIIKKYRKLGIGTILFKNAIEWLNENKVDTKKLIVAAGNEEVFEYYKKFNFMPLIIVMQQIDDTN